MKFTNFFKIAYKNIITNKLRSFLTMLGLVVGIASVIVLVGTTMGSTEETINEIETNAINT